MKRIIGTILLGLLSGRFEAAAAARVKELTSIEGVRDNQLIGYGLVVGLAGTGDRRQTVFSAQSLTNMLQRMGVSVSPTAIQVSNVAAVMITATLPPFGQPGARLDVTAAAIGDAKNLQGGLLLLTPLKGADGQVYAAAQGSVVTGGFVAGGSGTRQIVNHPTAGRIPGGAIIERTAPSAIPGPKVRLQLRQADFTTAARIAAVINGKFGSNGAIVAQAENSGAVTVLTPASYLARPVEFVSEMENLSVETDRLARIVINERTGTITIGKDVKISPIAILHGSLTVQIETSFTVSQPAPMASGETTLVPQVAVGVKEEKARNISLKNGANVDELVRALMAIGSTPRDIIAILQSLKTAGALEAELEVI
jgi:flagellar P-ring protein precursor FlgI